MDVTNNHSTELEPTEPNPDRSDATDREMTDRELLLAIYESQVATQRMVEGVIAEVGPMVESFANNPALKMLGFGGKMFGK